MYEFEFQGRRDLKAYKYRLEEDLTGQDFLDLRHASAGAVRVDMTAYNALNLSKRLKEWDRPEKLGEEALLALPQDVYTVLYNKAIDLDGAEMETAHAFLAKSLSPSVQQALDSILADSSEESPQPSEPSSPTESGGQSRSRTKRTSNQT
jgi:hypothetical protein